LKKNNEQPREKTMRSNKRKHPSNSGQPQAFLITGAALAMAGALQCSEANAAQPSTIALVPGIASDPFYITMHNGASAEAKKLGVNLIWQGGSSFSPETQLPILQSLLAKHPDALLVA